MNGTGNACLILARTLTEWSVNLEYMKVMGIDEQLEQFRLFIVAEKKHDVDYLTAQKVDISEVDTDAIQSKFEDENDLFIRRGKSDDIWRSWSHMQYESMVDVLLNKGVINE